MKLLLKKLKRAVPFFIRAEYFRIKKGIKNILNQRKYSSQKISQFPKGLRLIFSHRSQIIKNYPEPWYSSQFNKKDNLKIAADALNGRVFSPGESFSFWKYLGRPTRCKGYRKAMVIQDGKMKIASAGGLCQVSNALYWAALNLGFHIQERHRHSFDLFPDANRLVPFGAGATVFYNYLDLVFLNPLKETYFFKVYTDKDCLNLEIYSLEKPEFIFKIIEKNHRFFEIQGKKYRENEIWREKYDGNGNKIDDELICKNQGLVLY